MLSFKIRALIDYFFFSPSVIKEEGEEEDEEEMEDEEEDDDAENVDNNKDKPSSLKETSEAPVVSDIQPEKSNRKAEEVGYSLLDGQDVTEDEPEVASSSCSSDLSFGASSSGMLPAYL